MLGLKKRRLRVDILTIFLSLFLSSLLIIVSYTHIRSNAAILKVGNDLIERNNQAIIEKLDNFLRPTPFIKMSSYLINDGVLDITDMQSLSAFMHIILQSYPQLTSVYIADTKGDIFFEYRLTTHTGNHQLVPFVNNADIPPETAYLSQILTHPNQQSMLSVHYKNSEGDLIKTQQINSINYDPRSRPWYIGATALKDHPWIGIYPFYGTQKNGISISFAFHTANQITGVAAADLSIDIISAELKKYSTGPNSLIFIINNHEKIIIQKDANSSNIDLPTLSELGNPLITTAYKIHRETHNNHFDFKFNNLNYIATFTPYAFSPTETWEIVSIIPLDTFIGDMEDANKNALIFSFIMLIIGLILIIIFSHKISYPIIRVANATKDITNLKFDKEIKIPTHIYEVQVLIDALNATKSALSSFAKYVPKTLVEQLLQTKIIAEVGGKKQTLSILFTDIENFTEIAEQTEPEMLLLQLSEYLNVITQCIQMNKGNIDKYIGDAIMAFWGAPLHDADHAYHACQAILICQQEMRKMNDFWRAMGKPVLNTRFGLNSGNAIVGNMGSADRLNYTAIGDAVNLAARLETLNKIYKTHVIVSESIYSLCADKFLFRILDNVQIRGKRQLVSIYELIAEKPGSSTLAATAEQVELCELSTKGYAAYTHNDFTKALEIFKTLSEKFPEDGMAKIYIKRCQDQGQV